MKENKLCGIIGHQPSSLPFGFDPADSRCARLKQAIGAALETVISEDGVRGFLCPVNVGAEMLASEAVQSLPGYGDEITLTAVLPFETQSSDWSEADRDRYFGILQRCTGERFTGRYYDDTCAARNHDAILVEADVLLAVWNGAPGEIAYTVQRAREKNLPVIRIDPNRA